MIDLKSISDRYSIEVGGIVHVGAHVGQEVDSYLELTSNIVLWEPLPSMVAQLRASWPALTIVQAAAWDSKDTLAFYVTSFLEGSSLMVPIEHEVIETTEVQAMRLDESPADDCNVLVVDTQGSELKVLMGAELSRYDLVIVETNDRKRYDGAPLRQEIIDYMSDSHSIVEHVYHSDDQVIADSVFVKNGSRVVIIAAGGKGKRWNNYLGVQKHQVKIDGIPLIDRTIKQFEDEGDRAVVIHDGDTKYGDLDKLYSSNKLWNRKGRTIVLFGDTYFTDAAVRKISDYPHPGFVVFGRIEPSTLTGKQYGELFAVSFYSNDIETIERAIERVSKLEERGVVHSANLWALYRAMHRFPDDLMDIHYAGNGVEVIHDWTEDLDWPQDYDRFIEARGGS